MTATDDVTLTQIANGDYDNVQLYCTAGLLRKFVTRSTECFK